MPIYEYCCDHCSHQFEVKQGFDDKPEAQCPLCKGKAHRVLHSAPIIFKGSGFFVTDNRKPESPGDGKEAITTTKKD